MNPKDNISQVSSYDIGNRYDGDGYCTRFSSHTIVVCGHKHYVVVGGIDHQLEKVLHKRRMSLEKFRRWAPKHLHPTDAVVIEASTNTWVLYDLVVPLVGEMDEQPRGGLTRQQFVRYALMHLGIGDQITRIEYGGYPRRIASVDEMLALRPELRPPG